MSDDQDPKPGGRREMPEEVKAALRGKTQEERERAIQRVIALCSLASPLADPKTLLIFGPANEAVRRLADEQAKKPEK